MSLSTTVTSPKVKAGAIGGSATAIVLAALSMTMVQVTPDMFTALGPYSILVSTLITALAGGITAYLKKDPMRVGADEIQAQVEAAVNEAIEEYTAAAERDKAKAVAAAREEAKLEAAAELAVADPDVPEDTALAPEEYVNTAAAVG